MNPNQLPDWEWHNLSDEEIRQLDLLDDLRRDHPIVWALILGHHTSQRIARNLGMPHHAVLYELRRYKHNLHWCHDEQFETAIHWKLDNDDHLELQAFVRRVRQQNRALDRDSEG